jgi:2-C-methyl-D-erythritol 4-phosphate cytidylyltransferase
MNRFAIIVAGGKGQRFGSTIPKQFMNLKGLPVLMHTIRSFFVYDSNIKLIVSLPEDYIESWQLLCKEYNFTIPHKIIAGGETRFHSVLNGLNVIESNGIVAVHDAVRPLVSIETLQRCFETAARMGNAIPVVTPVDSIRELIKNESRQVNRDSFALVQTPQIFDIKLLKEAYKLTYHPDFTDDASLVEKIGTKIILVEGNRENIKITTQTDLLVAEALMNKK